MSRILIIGNGTLGKFTKKYLIQTTTKPKKADSYLFFDTNASKSDLSLKERNNLLTTVDEVYYCASFSENDDFDTLVQDIKKIRSLMQESSILILRTTLPTKIAEFQNYFEAYWPALEKECVLRDSGFKIKNSEQLIGLSKGVVTLLNLCDKVNFEHVTTVETALTAKIAINNAIVKTSAMIQSYLDNDSVDSQLDKDTIASLVFKKIRSLTFVTPYIGGTCLTKDLHFENTADKTFRTIYSELDRVQDAAIENTKFQVYNYLKGKTNFVLILKGVTNYDDDTSWYKNKFLVQLVKELSDIKKPKYVIVSDVVRPTPLQETALVENNYKLGLTPLVTDLSYIEKICADKKYTAIEIEFQPNANAVSSWISSKLWEPVATGSKCFNIKLYSTL